MMDNDQVASALAEVAASLQRIELALAIIVTALTEDDCGPEGANASE